MASRYGRRLRAAIINYSTIDTVYERTLQTVAIKVQPMIAADEGVSLLTVSNVRDVCEIIRAIFGQLDDDQEHFILLVLNLNGDVAGYKVLASGAMDHVVVDPKVIFRNALLLGAARFIVSHNHPSGSPKPSQHDHSLTHRLAQLGAMMDLPLVDHIIFAGDKCVSMRELNPEWFFGGGSGV